MSNETFMNSGEGRYLCFSVGGERYAIPLLHVREVLGKLSFTPIPQSPAYFQGIVNLRGQVISVIDLQRRLHQKPGGEAGPERATIILDAAGLNLGVTVDSVDCVRKYNADALSEPPVTPGWTGPKNFVLQVAREDKNMVLILDLTALLSDADRELAARKNECKTVA